VLAFGATIGSAAEPPVGTEDHLAASVGLVLTERSAPEAPQRSEQSAPVAQPESTPSPPRTPPNDVGSDTFDPADPPMSTTEEPDDTEAEEPENEATEPPEVEDGPEETSTEPPPTSSGDSSGSSAPDAEEAPPAPAKEEETEADEPPPPPPPPAVTSSPGAADRIFSLIQDSRASAGLAALQRHAGADGVAQAWAEQMATDGVLSHNPDFASQLWSAVGSGAVAENVGSIRPADPAALHQQFMGSASHKANMLGSYTYAGIGAAEDANGTLWVVQTFVEPN
jgi:uncharacterized protein YkwD